MGEPATGEPATTAGLAEPDGLVENEASWLAIDPLVAYAILRLRSAVFVVEQQCPYLDVDGRDVEAGAQHRWLSPAADPMDVLAYVRVLREGQAVRIGRVVTAPAARGQGLASWLVASTVAAYGEDRELVLDAQAHLVGLYAAVGFSRSGPDFDEDGIRHTPMRRLPKPPSRPTTG